MRALGGSRAATDLTGYDTFELREAVTTFAFPRTYEALHEALERGEDVGLEPLLLAEIGSKGISDAIS